VAGLDFPFTLIAAVVTTAAVGWLAQRMIPGRFSGLAAAVVFASMPLVASNAAALPVALLLILVIWLAAIDRYQRTNERRWLSIAAAALGAGVAVGGDAIVLLPVLAVGSAAILLLVEESPAVSWRDLVLPTLFALLAAAPFAIYLAMHPEWLASRAAAHHLYDPARFNPLQGAREITSWVGLAARSEIYWHYLDPAFLFMSGAVFLLPAVALLPVGIARAATGARRLPALVLLGFLAAPLPAALLLQPPAAPRLLAAAPFAALLIAAALESLWRAEPKWQRVTGVLLAVALVLSALVTALAPSSSLP
jgi:hypothetical protein